MHALAALPFVLAAIWLVRVFVPLGRLVAHQRALRAAGWLLPRERWQYRVDCQHPRGWYDSYSFFFDRRLRAALYARRMRAKGWDVAIHGERWA